MEGIWCSLREFGQFKLGRHGANHYQVHPWKCLKFDKTRNVEKNICSNWKRTVNEIDGTELNAIFIKKSIDEEG